MGDETLQHTNIYTTHMMLVSTEWVRLAVFQYEFSARVFRDDLVFLLCSPQRQTKEVNWLSQR